MLILLAIGLSLIAALYQVYQYFVWHSLYWRRRGIPGPEGRLYFGNSKQLNNLNYPHAKQINDWTKEFGTTYGIKEGTMNALVTSDMNLVQEVFVKQFDNFYSRRRAPVTHDIDNDSRVHLFESRGARWKRLRNLSSPSFSVNSLKKINALVDDSATKLVDIMEKRQADGGLFNIHQYFMEYTMDTISRLVMGQEESRLFQNPRVAIAKKIFMRDLNRPITYLSVAFPSLANLLGELAFRFNLPVLGGAPKIFYEMEAAVSRRLKQREEEGAPDVPRDFIDLFLDSAADIEIEGTKEFVNGGSVVKALSVDEVLMQSVVFLLAGFDTTSNALAYTAWRLAKNPEVMRRCQEEIDEVCTEEMISYEDCTKLRFLDATCKETLRFHPLGARAVSRICMKDTMLGEIEVEKGTLVVADSLEIHFKKDIWGEDAEEFKPERWLDSDRKVPSFAYLPFGAGPRTCIGMRLAIMEEKIALAHILRRFDIIPDPSLDELHLQGCTSICPKEVPVRIQTRS